MTDADLNAMTMNNPSDDSLDFAFAAVVAGIPPDVPDMNGNPLRGLYYGDAGRRKVPRFTASLEAVLPYLEQMHWWTKTGPGNTITLGVYADDDGPGMVEAQDPSLPRACVLAMLRAKGVGV